MTRLAITFLVGVFLFLAGGTGGAWALILNCKGYLNGAKDMSLDLSNMLDFS